MLEVHLPKHIFMNNNAVRVKCFTKDIIYNVQLGVGSYDGSLHTLLCYLLVNHKNRNVL